MTRRRLPLFGDSLFNNKKDLMIVVAFFVLLLLIVGSSYFIGAGSHFEDGTTTLVRLGFIYLFWAGVCFVFFNCIN